MILGLDFDTRAVHAVLLDDDSNAARYVSVPIRDKRGSFDAARNVHEAVLEQLCRGRPYYTGGQTASDDWAVAKFSLPLIEDVWLCGIEDSMYRSAQTVRALARVQGAILASLPRGLCVLPLTAQEWKRETVGKTNASKDEVREWAERELGIASWNMPGAYRFVLDWPQDAFDAYCIARAARSLNARGIAAA